jgi:hypothetical protein
LSVGEAAFERAVVHLAKAPAVDEPLVSTRDEDFFGFLILDGCLNIEEPDILQEK